ncbi:MAG: AAA family ATPase [Candidatus Delongbacteria bacterium]|nr:AAA family ATPase [Candidatus Delongbacteria bacterium]
MLDEKKLHQANQAARSIKTEISKIIVGQDEVINQLMIALFSGGHSLLIGVPGLAKTLMINTLARILDLSFKRIQFTPDLMPTDITGSEILEEDVSQGRKVFRFVQGPIFANLILADEINRTPPKTQSALLEAMQEHAVTAAGKSYPLPEPFFVLATQNPIEQEGTYPLPEAQLDRFMMNILVDYPDQKQEIEIVKRTTGADTSHLKPLLSAGEIQDIQHMIRQIPVEESVIQYAVRLARSTRPVDDQAPDYIKKYLAWGAGPRASQYLILGAKTKAMLEGTLVPGIQDVQAIAPIILRHRLITNFTAEAEGITPDQLIRKLLTQ